jgi:hydrogenase/urease accessory protein HupE
MDRDGDGVVSPAELASSEAVLREEMERGVLVVSDGRPCTSSLEGGGDVEDGFGVSLSFACPAPVHVLGVELLILGELSHGHRHTLRISAGPASVEKILSSEDRFASLDVAQAGDAERRPWKGAFGSTWLGAWRMGVLHILTGWDHLLFLAALLIGARKWKSVLVAASAFTVAHSITLLASVLDVWAPSPRWVEPAIAASIAFVAFENAVYPRAAPRWRAAFFFGLIHGFGFAGALRELSLDRDRRVPTLLGFNLGVEVGQVAIVVLAMPLVAWLCRRRAFETPWLRGVSVAMGVAGVLSCVVRIAKP